MRIKKLKPQVVHYTAERIPDDRPGGPATSEQFNEVLDALETVCERHGPTGGILPDGVECIYYPIQDQYNYERYQYIEVCKPEGMNERWLRDVMGMLQRFPQWGVGITNLERGYILVFEDRVMVKGPVFKAAKTLKDVVREARRCVELQDLLLNTHDDAGLKRLTAIPELRKCGFWLWKLNQVSDAGMPFAAKLRRVSLLDLADSAVTDIGLVHLKSLRRLESLFLCRTRVTGTGLLHLKGITSLTGLSLEGCPLAPESLPTIRGFSNLESLDLSNTALSSGELSLFERLKKLNRLDIRGTKVSKAAIRRFRKAVPACEVLGPEPKGAN